MNVDASTLAHPSTDVDWRLYHVLVALKQLPVIREKGECCALPAVSSSWAEHTSDLLKALSDPTRLTMMASLHKADAPICVCDFTAGLQLSQPTISHHMAKLKRAGLVESEKRGIWVYYRIKDRLDPASRKLLAHLVSG